MSKPWARIELGRMRHPKFLALTGNAIALWDEGKDFCDEYQTEGYIPLETLKTFRFRAPRSVALLAQSIGRRVSGEVYAPLWEVVDGGYQMHGYLERNDARTVVETRLEDANDRAELRQAANRARQAQHRATRKAELSALRNALPAPLRTQSASRPTETPPETPPEEKKEKSPHTLPRARGSLIQGAHPAHAVCGRVCVPAFLHREFLTAIGGPEDIANQRLWEWYSGVWNALPEGDAVEPDAVKFWRPRFTAQFVKAAVLSKTEAQRTVDVAAEIQRQERVAGR